MERDNRLLEQAWRLRLLAAIERLDPHTPALLPGVTRKRELLTIQMELEEFAELLLNRGQVGLDFKGRYDCEDDPLLYPSVDPLKQMKFEADLEKMERGEE
jgi:hypothetical protein